MVDDSYKDNGIDGALVSWSISIKTLSNKKVQANGRVLATQGLWVNKAMQLPREAAPPVTCNAPNLGHMYVDTKLNALRFCNGAQWVVLSAWGLGESKESAGLSCKALFDKGAKTSGVYWIKPFGTAVQAYCDMTLLGGGWTMVYKHSAGTSVKHPASYWNKPTHVGDTTLLHTKASSKLYSIGKLDIPGAARILAVVYINGQPQSWWGFANVNGDLNASWRKDKIDASLTKVVTSGFDASLISLSAETCRAFYITNNHGGCGNDAGALVVSGSGCGPGCSWEKNDAIFWWGGPGNYRNYTNGIRKDGKVLALYVR